MITIRLDDVTGLLDQFVEPAAGGTGTQCLLVEDLAQLVHRGGEFTQLAVVGSCRVE
ncbi:Uncharacterised protein [Mycobacteroides abscessus]|nr:Uncharacterised protein [Mycobacteroides abscessus]